MESKLAGCIGSPSGQKAWWFFCIHPSTTKEDALYISDTLPHCQYVWEVSIIQGYRRKVTALVTPLHTSEDSKKGLGGLTVFISYEW